MKKLFRIYAIVTILNIVILTLLYFLFPKLQYFLFAEDKLVEDLTVLFYLLSFLIGIYLIVRLKDKKHRKIYIAITFVSLIGALEELSYGQQIFKLKMPYIYDVQIDAIHDFIELGHNILIEQGNTLLYFLLSAIFCFISIVVFLKYRKYFSQIPDMLRKYPLFGFFLISLSFNLSAQVFDLNLVKPQLFVALEELFEMNGALTMLFATFSIGYPSISYDKSDKLESNFIKKIPVLVGTVLILFILFGSTNFIVSSIYTNKLKKESRAYAERVIPLIFSSWNAEAMVNNMPSDLYNKAFYQKLQASFGVYEKEFGKLENYKIVKDKLKMKKLTLEDKDVSISFKYYAIATFQKTSAKLTIMTVFRENEWHLQNTAIQKIQ